MDENKTEQMKIFENYLSNNGINIEPDKIT